MSQSKVTKFCRLVLFGDEYGLPRLLRIFPKEYVQALVIASNRPQYHNSLQQLAQQQGHLLLIQPAFDSPQYSHFIEHLVALKPDLILCDSYSLILRPDLLNIVSYAAINAHAALLPKNRGPNPLQWALIKNETHCGVSLHLINDTVDGGPVIDQTAICIEELDTWVSLRDKVQLSTENLWHANLENILAMQWCTRPQIERQSSTNPRLNPEYPCIEWQNMNNRQIFNLIRAQVAPLSGAYTIHNGQKIYFKQYVPYEKISDLRSQYHNCVNV